MCQFQVVHSRSLCWRDDDGDGGGGGGGGGGGNGQRRLTKTSDKTCQTTDSQTTIIINTLNCRCCITHEPAMQLYLI